MIYQHNKINNLKITIEELDKIVIHPGAICVYSYRDFMITNNMNKDFELRISIGTKYLEGT